MANGELLVMDPTGVYNLSEIAGSVKVQQPWNNGASTLRFEYPRQGGRRFENGSTVTFTYNGANIFYGYLQRTSCGTLSPQTPFCARKCPFPTG